MDATTRVEATEILAVSCPCCGEAQTILVEADVRGCFVQDCEVCCRPWEVTVRRQADGSAAVSVEDLS